MMFEDNFIYLIPLYIITHPILKVIVSRYDVYNHYKNIWKK